MRRKKLLTPNLAITFVRSPAAVQCAAVPCTAGYKYPAEYKVHSYYYYPALLAMLQDS
jgi:hypothetical protein